MNANYFFKNDLREYLADTSRTSGSVLSMVESEPERYQLWLAGKSTDRASAAMGRGSYVHARLLEPETVSSAFAFYPSRNTPTERVMREVLGPRGGKKLVPTDELEPQDGSDRGASKSIKRVSTGAKKAHADFLESARGLTIVYPEDQPIAEAMIRAVGQHPEAAALLAFDGGFAPELTGHWTCPDTGELMQIRPDAVRIEERVWIEIKTVEPRPGERLDTRNARQISRWLGQGWHRKSALLHDGCRLITGKPFVGYWIIIEATADSPRVSVVRDQSDEPGSLCDLGRDGCAAWGLRGYFDLVKEAQEMRSSNDFRHACTIDVVQRWELPESLTTSMRFEADAAGGVQLTGAREVSNG